MVSDLDALRVQMQGCCCKGRGVLISCIDGYKIKVRAFPSPDFLLFRRYASLEQGFIVSLL